MSSTYRVSHSYDPEFLTMAVPHLPPTTGLPHRRPLMPRQIKASNKRPTSLHATTHDPHSLTGLPRELRGEIFWLAVQDDVGRTSDTELVSRPGPTIKALTQFCRNVRVEAASIYWSRTKFKYSTHNLLRDEALGDYRCHYKLRSWLSTLGGLAVQHVRRLKLTLPFNMGGLDIRLSKKSFTRSAVCYRIQQKRLFLGTLLLTSGGATGTDVCRGRRVTEHGQVSTLRPRL